MKRPQVFFTTATLAALLLCLAGCKTKERVVMVETVRTDTTYITQQQRDSIYVHDSVYVSEQQTGDTITRTISKWSVKFRDRAVHDTIYKVRTDSVPYPVEVTEFVPAPLTWWQQTRLHLANIVLYALAIFAAVYGVRLWMRR